MMIKLNKKQVLKGVKMTIKTLYPLNPSSKKTTSDNRLTVIII